MLADNTQTLGELAATLVLGALLDLVTEKWGGYELIGHWQQGEFHHDVVLRIPAAHGTLPGEYLAVATNCNGGIKEVLAFQEPPTHGGLWRARCPENPEFEGELPQVLGRAITHHWFDPCELLGPDARSEYREEFRTRQPGGGWMPKKC